MRRRLERCTVGALRRGFEGLSDDLHVVFVGGSGGDFGEDIAIEIAIPHAGDFDRSCAVVHLDMADDDGDTPIRNQS